MKNVSNLHNVCIMRKVIKTTHLVFLGHRSIITVNDRWQINMIIVAEKSRFTAILAQDLETKLFYENVADNEGLPFFYSNADKYAFLLQIFFLNEQFRAIKDAFSHADNVLDRLIYEDSILFHLNVDIGRVSQEEVA